MAKTAPAPLMLLRPAPLGRRLLAALVADRRVLAWWVAGVVAFLAFLAALNLAGASVANLTRDPNGITGRPAYFGALSTVGLIGWGVAASLCAVVALVLGDGARRRYLLATAVLLTLLLLDDGLLLHERLLPSAFGLSEDAVYALYAGATLAWLMAFRREIVRSDAVLLVLAGACLVTSIVLDGTALAPAGLEDAPKLVGIGSLIAYAVREARRRLQPAPDE